MFHKVILLGEQRVGKTTLRRSFMGKSLDRNYQKTIGVDFSVKKHPLGAFQIWDIAGEGSTNTVTSYLDGSQGILLVCSLVDLDTIVKLDYWLDLIIKTLDNKFFIALIGNKTDLRKTPNRPDNLIPILERSRNLFNEDSCKYFETSALYGTGVEKAFEWLFSCLHENSNKSE